jgi:arsenate reductase-like glutaredoxin family protein
MQNPNLLRRPIVIRGSKVIFGFDKDRYDKEVGSGRKAGGARG